MLHVTDLLLSTAYAARSQELVKAIATDELSSRSTSTSMLLIASVQLTYWNMAQYKPTMYNHYAALIPFISYAGELLKK